MTFPEALALLMVSIMAWQIVLLAFVQSLSAETPPLLLGLLRCIALSIRPLIPNSISGTLYAVSDDCLVAINVGSPTQSIATFISTLDLRWGDGAAILAGAIAAAILNVLHIHRTWRLSLRRWLCGLYVYVKSSRW